MEELFIKTIEIQGLESQATLEMVLTTKSLSNSESNTLKNTILFNSKGSKEVNLLLFSHDQCQIKISLTKDISKILQKFSDRKFKCDILKQDYENLLLASQIKKMKEAKMTPEELEKSLASQMEILDKKYDLEERIRKCSQKTTLKKFRK